MRGKQSQSTTILAFTGLPVVTKKVYFGFLKNNCANIQCKFCHLVTPCRFVKAVKVCKCGTAYRFSGSSNTLNMKSSAIYP